MAYTNDSRRQCLCCTALTSLVLYNRYNSEQGSYCSRHMRVALRMQERTERATYNVSPAKGQA